MSEPCRYEDRIINALEDIASFKTALETAIKKTSEHIEMGSKYRLAIVCACIGLVGTILGAVVKFAIMDYKVNMHGSEIAQIRSQVYDLNYIRGKAEGIAEKQ